MKYFIFALSIFFPINAYSQSLSYQLSIDTACSLNSVSRSAECDDGVDLWTDNQGIIIEKNSWCYKDEVNGDCPKGRILKDDEFITVLEANKSYSGSSILHLYKKTGRFVWTEITYSKYKESGISTFIMYGSYK